MLFYEAWTMTVNYETESKNIDIKTKLELKKKILALKHFIVLAL